MTTTAAPTPRISTMIWGFILIGVAALAAAFASGALDEVSTGMRFVLIQAALGAMLLLGALVGVIVRLARGSGEDRPRSD